jgi:hypothetical protein
VLFRIEGALSGTGCRDLWFHVSGALNLNVILLETENWISRRRITKGNAVIKEQVEKVQGELKHPKAAASVKTGVMNLRQMILDSCKIQ